MFVGLMRDVHATFAERWLKLQIEIGPPPGDVGGPNVRGPRPGPVSGSRRPTPMVASKAEADGLIRTDTPAGPKPTPGAPAPNPYAGVGRNDPCPCGSGKKFKKCHGAAV